MFESIWNDIKQQFNYGNMVTRLIIVNIAVFVVINLLWMILKHGNAGVLPQIYNDIVHFFCISSSPVFILTHPWSILTNMFMHERFWHILWNMLYLFWFGRIFGDLLGDKRVLPLYLLGGMAGAFAFFVSANLLPYGGEATRYALGASGAVMAIVVAAGVTAPEYSIRLLFLGDVKLKYIVAVLIFLDLIGTANDMNTGGHFAHLGGALFGWFFVNQLKQGNDLAVPVNNLIDKIRNFFAPKKGPRVAYKNPNFKKRKRSNEKPHRASGDGNLSHQEELDKILDKIKVKGYDSLSAEEKEFLFNASKK